MHPAKRRGARLGFFFMLECGDFADVVPLRSLLPGLLNEEGMPRLRLSLLGPLTITLDGEPFDGVRLRPTLALCSYLACQPGRHRRERLMALLWPDWPQASAQQNLRQNLYVLRQALPEIDSHNGDRVPLVLADRDTVQLNPAAVVEVDVLRFTGLLENPQPTPLQLAEAVALYHGDFLADFYPVSYTHLTLPTSDLV